MKLSRRDLEEHRMRAIYMAAIDPRHPLTDEQLADNLEDFLATLRKNAVTATAGDRQRVLRALVTHDPVGVDDEHVVRAVGVRVERDRRAIR